MGMNILCDGGTGYRDNQKKGVTPGKSRLTGNSFRLNRVT